MNLTSTSYDTSHFTSSEVGGAWGAAYALGTPLSALITGICCALAIEYFQQFPKDGTRIRASVIVVVATTIFGLFLAVDLTYVRLVRNETPPGGFGEIPWQDDAVALVCGICQLICSAYFAYSAYSVATRKKLLAVWLGLLMATLFLSAFFRAIFGLLTLDWFDGVKLCPKMTFLWLIGSLLLDFSIAVTLLGHLRTVPSTPLVVASALPPPSSVCPSTTLQRVPRPRAPLLSRLLTTILTTFSLTAILMFSLLILVLAMHGTEFDAELPEATGIFTALRLLATPIYAVTFLYTLNRRHWKESTLDRPATSEQHFPLGICEAQSAPYALQTERHFDKSHLHSGNQENWPTFFTVLPPSKSKTTDTKNRKKCTSQNLKTDLLSPFGQKFKKVGSCGPFRTTLSDSSWLQPSVAQAPSPVHTVENQREIDYHTSRTFSIQSHCAALNDMGIEEAPPIHAGGMSVPYCPGTAL